MDGALPSHVVKFSKPIHPSFRTHDGQKTVGDNLQLREIILDQQNRRSLVEKQDDGVEAGAAKRRKIMLEYQLTQKEIQMARQLEDFQRQGQRERTKQN
jgi:hypothetical protein